MLTKCVNDAYFRFQEVKIYQIGYFTRKIASFAKIRYFGRHFVFWPPISTGSCFPNVLMTHIFGPRRSKSIRKAIFLEKIALFAKNDILAAILYFWPRISTRSWQRRKLNYNPKPSYEKYYSHTKLQENRIKTVVVTVLSFLRQIWRPWRHQLC